MQMQDISTDLEIVQVDIWEKNVLGIWRNKRERPEIEACLVCSEMNTEACAAITE